MKAIYEDLLHLDRPFYEIHEDSYDPLKCIESKLEAVQQTLFLADILRALMAYFLTHSRHLDTTQIKLSTLEANMKELQLTKKINDFFQSINQSKP